MSDFRVRPLRVWPGPETFGWDRSSGGQFTKVTARGALDSLEHELVALGATEPVLEMDVQERDLTLHGTLRASARPARPGVVLYVTHPRQGALRFACDRFLTWYHNVRAIALTLEALRGIERWGAVQDGAQFTGFKALPGATALTMGSAAAVAVLAKESGLPAPEPMTAEWVQAAGRLARAATHPDIHNGERTAWDQVEAALRILGGGR